jgi:hypothetical protein
MVEEVCGVGGLDFDKGPRGHEGKKSFFSVSQSKALKEIMSGR